eukprot:scaffold8651_cov134-Skeletonema_marinoi.AAC.8
MAAATVAAVGVAALMTTTLVNVMHIFIIIVEMSQRKEFCVTLESFGFIVHSLCHDLVPFPSSIIRLLVGRSYSDQKALLLIIKQAAHSTTIKI